MRTKLSVFAFASLASFALVACSSSTNEGAGDGDGSDVDSTEGEVRACSDVYARSFYVSLDARSCADVAGERGTWVAKPLEGNATDAVCTMSWQGEKYSRADMNALRAFVKERDAMTAACGSSGSKLDLGALTPIPRLDMVGMIGANGCDVCAKIRRDGKVIVILPPYRTQSRQFEVPVSDGTSRAFQVEAPEGAHAVSVQLPSLPSGLTYTASRVTVY